MRLSVVRCFGLLLLAVVGIASRADAASILVVPPGLSPGDSYRLVFVTSTLIDASSWDIAVYNTHVSDAANAVPELAGLSTTWTALASTPLINVIDNVGVSAPSVGVFRLDGLKVDMGLGAGVGLYSGAILSAIAIDETGNATGNPYVWTGTDSTSLASPGLGSVPYYYGLSGVTYGAWTYDGVTDRGSYALYAISDELTAPEVPEPGTIGLTALGVAFLFLARRRKQQKDQAT